MSYERHYEMLRDSFTCRVCGTRYSFADVGLHDHAAEREPDLVDAWRAAGIVESLKRRVPSPSLDLVVRAVRLGLPILGQ